MSDVRWEPVNQQVFARKETRWASVDNETGVVNVTTEGASFYLYLESDLKVCRPVEAESPAAPVTPDIAQIITDMAGDWLQTYDEGDEDYDRARQVLYWLSQQEAHAHEGE